MPQISSNDLAILRSGSQYSRVGMFVFRQKIIATGVVSGSPGVGDTDISLDDYSATGTVRAYYTVIAGSSPGDNDGGKIRLKSISGGNISVAYNNIIWTDYPYVSILEEILPWAILPDLGNDYMDGNVPYTNQNSNYRPLARIGPPAWGYTGQPVKFWANSVAYDNSARGFNSNNVVSHSWGFSNGTPSSSSSSGSAENPIEVVWNTATGHTPEYIRYTVTDNNGNTHTRYNPVWIVDSFEQDMYCDIEIESISGDYSSGGWEAEIVVRSGATFSDFQSNAMIMIVAEDWYNGVKTSIGGNWKHRENVLFVGWVIGGTVFKDADTGYVNFSAMGTMGLADKLFSWPANLEYNNSPFAWNKLKNMTCDMTAYHIITERTTLDHIVDLNLTGNNKILRYVDIPNANVSTQLNDYCLSPIGAKALSDRQGQMYFSRNPNLRPLSERTSIESVCDVELTDIRSDPGLELATESQHSVVSQVDFIGFKYNGLDATSLYSLAPRRELNTGRIEKVDGIRSDDQTENNILSGLYLANFNNIWTQIRFPLYNMRIVDIVPEEYVLFSLTENDTERGIVWDQQKLIPRSIDINIDTETESIEVDVTLEKDCWGPPGVTNGGYSEGPPSRNASAKPSSRITRNALAVWGSWYIRGDDSIGFESRGNVDTTTSGCVDQWWFVADKQGTFDPNSLIAYNVQNGGILQRTKNGGFTWQDITLSSPPNSWSDSSAPSISDIDMKWIEGDSFQNGRFYILAEWQNSGNEYRGWMCVTNDDFITHTWYPLYDGVTLPTEIRPLGVKSNNLYILVTVWVDDILELQVYNTFNISHIDKKSLGSCTGSQLFDDYVAYPQTVIDEISDFFVFGRMNSPQSLSNPSHIIRYVNGTWSEVENSWGAYICGSFYASKKDSNRQRKFYAVKNT